MSVYVLDFNMNRDMASALVRICSFDCTIVFCFVVVFAGLLGADFSYAYQPSKGGDRGVAGIPVPDASGTSDSDYGYDYSAPEADVGAVNTVKNQVDSIKKLKANRLGRDSKSEEFRCVDEMYYSVMLFDMPIGTGYRWVEANLSGLVRLAGSSGDLMENLKFVADGEQNTYLGSDQSRVTKLNLLALDALFRCGSNSQLVSASKEGVGKSGDDRVSLKGTERKLDASKLIGKKCRWLLYGDEDTCSSRACFYGNGQKVAIEDKVLVCEYSAWALYFDCARDAPAETNCVNRIRSQFGSPERYETPAQKVYEE